MNPKIKFRGFKKDGQPVSSGQKVAEISGPVRSILTAERTGLNFLSRLSGIATLTNAFVQKIKGTGAKIFDTRKTAPGLRELEKYVVKSGGGTNHRFGLYDGILIKDNHISAVLAAGEVKTRTEAIKYLVQKSAALFLPLDGGGEVGVKKPEVEVENHAEALAAASAGAAIIMLDNMTPLQVRSACRKLKAVGFRGEIEVSGGITLDNVRQYALAGADRISIGRLTHSAPALDFSLEIISKKFRHSRG